MAVKIRLARRGRKKLALFDVVVADSRSPRDGRFIEKIGSYNPNVNPASIELNTDAALSWLEKGAQPTDTVRAMLRYKGVMMRRHLQIGVAKGAITQDVADARFNEWIGGKTNQVEAKKAGLVDKKQNAFKERLEAERKVKEARAEALRQREAAALAAAQPEEAPAAAETEAEGEAPEAAAE